MHTSYTKLNLEHTPILLRCCPGGTDGNRASSWINRELETLHPNTETVGWWNNWIIFRIGTVLGPWIPTCTLNYYTHILKVGTSTQFQSEKEERKGKEYSIARDINSHTSLHAQKALWPVCITFWALTKKYHQASQLPQELQLHTKSQN